MITHDVDEAIYLADRIVLMTNGPDAALAEIVDNPLPKDRTRTDFHRHPLYYARAQPPHRFPGDAQQELRRRRRGHGLRQAPRARGAPGAPMTAVEPVAAVETPPADAPVTRLASGH